MALRLSMVKSSLNTWYVTPKDFAVSLITSRAPPWAAVTRGTPSLIIPALWRAISSTVSPQYAWWSMVTFVITATSGVMTFVESSNPPKPTSMTA